MRVVWIRQRSNEKIEESTHKHNTLAVMYTRVSFFLSSFDSIEVYAAIKTPLKLSLKFNGKLCFSPLLPLSRR